MSYSESEAKAILLAAAYSSLGSTLQESGMLDERWARTETDDLSFEDREMLDLLGKMEKVVLKDGLGPAKKRQEIVNGVLLEVGKVQGSMDGNHALFSLFLVEAALKKPVGPVEMMIKTKIETLLPSVAAEVERVAGLEMRKNSFFIADNIRRRLVGEAVLSDEARTARARGAIERLRSRARLR